MLLNARLARRAVAGAIGTGAVAGAMFARPRWRLPISLPTAPLVTWRRCGRVFQRHVGLPVHPPVGERLFTSLQGQPRDQIRQQVRDYLAANPREQAEIQAFRQPLTDLRNRCGTGTTVPTP